MEVGNLFPPEKHLLLSKALMGHCLSKSGLRKKHTTIWSHQITLETEGEKMKTGLGQQNNKLGNSPKIENLIQSTSGEYSPTLSQGKGHSEVPSKILFP